MLCPGFCYSSIMPNAPKTPTRTVRISDEIWNKAMEVAKAKGVTVTSVIIAALETFIEENLTK